MGSSYRRATSATLFLQLLQVNIAIAQQEHDVFDISREGTVNLHNRHAVRVEDISSQAPVLTDPTVTLVSTRRHRHEVVGRILLGIDPQFRRHRANDTAAVLA